ncbi:MAG TPA: aspartate kinase [Thermoanaerobaculia bacterium]|nr:aspartate kinase [Thermoanaerobaculia bacterium]
MSERPLSVHKLGGTSLGDAERIVRAARLLAAASRRRRVVAVASAMGGATDLLLRAAHEAERGRLRPALRSVAELRSRHEAAAAGIAAATGASVDLDLAPFVELGTALSGIALLRERTPRVTDLVASFGERLSVPLLAAALEAKGVPARAVDARTFLVTDAAHGAATCDRRRTDPKARRLLGRLLAEGVVPVVTGFVGRTPSGETTTLGRSGSDTTAALLGAALGAREVVIWTDVDGVMTADPRIVPGARLLPRLSYREAAEMTYFGAKVLHFPAVLPAVAARIPLVIRSSFAPDGPGTTISEKGDPRPGIRAVTAVSGLCLLSLDGKGMTGVPGIAARVFQTTARLGVSVVMFSQASSEQNIAIVLPEADRARTAAALVQEFRYEKLVGAIDGVAAKSPIAVVSAVGDGMRGTVGIAAKVFAAVARAGVNVESIAQGSSECNISFAVDEKDRVAAVRALHEAVAP